VDVHDVIVAEPVDAPHRVEQRERVKARRGSEARPRDAGVGSICASSPACHGADAVPGVKDSDRIRAFHADMSSSLRHALDLVESSHEPRDRSRDEATDGA
jgi:hypothetical protein